MKYVLNSAVITAPGRYEYRLIPLDRATQWLKAGGWQSTIGYPETAEVLADLTGVAVPVDRRIITMAPGDEALVFRLVLPPGTPRLSPETKGKLGLRFFREHAEMGLLTREE